MRECRIESPFLDGFSEAEQISLLSAYAASLRRNQIGTGRGRNLISKTVQTAVTNVCSSFWTNFRGNPLLERTGERSIALSRQIVVYVKEDPAPKHQKCLPKVVFENMHGNHTSHLTTALGQLRTSALFWGMRSCEYSQVEGRRKTTLIYVKDIRFFKNRWEI